MTDWVGHMHMTDFAYDGPIFLVQMGPSYLSSPDIYIYIYIYTVEHIYDACPKYSELGNFRIIAYLYVSDGSRRWQRQYSKKKVQRFYI